MSQDDSLSPRAWHSRQLLVVALTPLSHPSGHHMRDSGSDVCPYHERATFCQAVPSGEDQGLHPACSVLLPPGSSAAFSAVHSEALGLAEALMAR